MKNAFPTMTCQRLNDTMIHDVLPCPTQKQLGSFGNLTELKVSQSFNTKQNHKLYYYFITFMTLLTLL